MKDELKSMKDNDVWHLIEFPKGKKSISCKWVFRTNQNAKGNVERYKAHLVTKKFTQTEGINHGDFLPVFS